MIIFLGLLAVTNAAKVLFSPSMLEPVHAYTMSHLANELASRGHQVTWLEYGPIQSKVSLAKSISQKYLPAPFDDGELNDLYVSREHPVYENMWDPYVDVETEQLTGWMAGTRLCDRVLIRHRQTFDALVAEKFDTVVVDDLYNPCGLLLAGLKGSVYVYWSMTGLRPESAWANQSPNPPSYLPTPGTGLTDDLSFIERVYNLAAYLKELYIHQHIVHTRIDAVFQKHYPGVETAFFLERNASINFVNTPPIFDFARPFMPRVNFVGGLHCHNATQLPTDIAKFVDSADEENGFVVISSGFNTQWDKAPGYVKTAFLDAFEANPKTKFVWQFNGDRRDLPSNVYVAEWLPLQDLLGHKKCRVHVTHGGLNSVIESVWHGVPVIGMPLTSRAYDNLLRLTARGVGVMIKKNKLVKDGELTRKLEEIKDKKYKDEMLIFQDMVRDVPYTELNHAAFWIEFIERHQEVPHARSGADKLNFLQYFLVDVILFMLSVVAIFVATVVFVLKTIWRLLVFVFSAIFGGKSGAAPKPTVSKAKKHN